MTMVKKNPVLDTKCVTTFFTSSTLISLTLITPTVVPKGCTLFKLVFTDTKTNYKIFKIR